MSPSPPHTEELLLLLLLALLPLLPLLLLLLVLFGLRIGMYSW
jgi:hypothetical protein